MNKIDDRNVVINGETKVVQTDWLTYDDVVLLALGALSVPSPSVIYKQGIRNTSGILSPGQSVYVVDGMKFSVAFTGNS